MSIEKNDRPCTGRLSFGVHQDPVPAVEDNGFVVWMPDASTHVGRRISHHLPPVPTCRCRVSPQEISITIISNTLRVMTTDPNRITTHANQKLAHVRFASATTDRFISQDQLWVYR